MLATFYWVCLMWVLFRAESLSDAMVLARAMVTWQSTDADEGTFTTLGVDSDQLAAAVIASEKMLNTLAPTGRSASRKRAHR